MEPQKNLLHRKVERPGYALKQLADDMTGTLGAAQVMAMELGLREHDGNLWI